MEVKCVHLLYMEADAYMLTRIALQQLAAIPDFVKLIKKQSTYFSCFFKDFRQASTAEQLFIPADHLNR